METAIVNLNTKLEYMIPTFNEKFLSQEKTKIIVDILDELRRFLSNYLNVEFSYKEDFSESVGYFTENNSAIGFNTFEIGIFVRSKDCSFVQFQEIGLSIRHNLEKFLNKITTELNEDMSFRERLTGLYQISNLSFKFEIKQDCWKITFIQIEK